MSAFKVVEIVDANTISVLPTWIVNDPLSNRDIKGHRVNIKGINTTNMDEYAKKRLEILLLNKDVELFNPELVEIANEEDGVVMCNVYLEKTDVVYYFPEYTQKKAGRIQKTFQNIIAALF